MGRHVVCCTCISKLKRWDTIKRSLCRNWWNRDMNASKLSRYIVIMIWIRANITIIAIGNRMTFMFTYLTAATITWPAKPRTIVSIIESEFNIIQTITESFISEAIKRWVGMSRILTKYACRGTIKILRNSTLLWTI